MLNSLSQSFRSIFERLSGRGKLRAEDVQLAAREIKLALLSADVHFQVVKEFTDRVSARAVGQEVLESVTPQQQFVKIVHDELVQMLGGESVVLDLAHRPPVAIAMLGLQGSGKTTTSAKLAVHCRRQGRRPMLVPCDLARPAAVEQLTVLANENTIDVYAPQRGDSPETVAQKARAEAERMGCDTVIIDTAGRLHVDDALMDEVQRVVRSAQAQHVLYVADAAAGQDALTAARAFGARLSLTGIVLTKLDGDARGGAALSVRSVTHAPLLFVGDGERVNDFSAFDPRRMAGRILGQGDVVSLVESVQQQLSADDLQQAAQGMQSGKFGLEEFLQQLKMMRKMGPMNKLMGMLPGQLGQLAQQVDPEVMRRELARREAMVLSMTTQERRNPAVLNGSRRKRIAAGAGVPVAELNRFLRDFEAMQKMMSGFKGRGMRNMLKNLTSPPAI